MMIIPLLKVAYLPITFAGTGEFIARFGGWSFAGRHWGKQWTIVALPHDTTIATLQEAWD